MQHGALRCLYDKTERTALLPIAENNGQDAAEQCSTAGIPFTVL